MVIEYPWTTVRFLLGTPTIETSRVGEQMQAIQATRLTHLILRIIGNYIIFVAGLALIWGCNSASAPQRHLGGGGAAEASSNVPNSNTTASPSTVVPQTSQTLPPGSDGAYLDHNNDGSQVAVLNTEADLLTARWNLLDSAKSAVWIQTYIFRGDYSGRQFAKKLLELKKKGIDVKIVIDDHANVDPGSQSLYAGLFQSGLTVVGFNPLYTRFITPLVQAGDIRTYLSTANKRSHEKMFIIDPQDPENKRAIVGGANIADDYFQIVKDKNGGYWRDKDVLLKGAIVDDIVDTFNKSLAYHKSLNENILKSSGTSTPLAALIQSLIGKKAADDPIAVAQFAKHTAQSLNLVWADANMRFLTQSPVTGRKDISKAYIDLIARATTEIKIANGYFIPNLEQASALKEAAARGVKIQILTNSEETTDYPQVARAGGLTYLDLLKDTALPLEIFEWGVPGSKAFSLYHSKYICADQVRCVVGSFNMDPRSHNLNGEVAVLLDGQTAVAPLLATFAADTGPTTSTKVTLEMAKKIANPSNAKDKLLNEIIRKLTPNI
ncbi:MAG: phosphatidylserine/phosphatidylglycerophosphate/cardiolipin synthase family protein [Proteobacteria bacterium]|nr:phosphatidylserine/phosphatidylglycerophosphate/cardiolipin synthase family protein [Pseudomonadota bacterium]